MRLRQVNCLKAPVLNETQFLAGINVLRLLLTLVNFQSSEKVDSGIVWVFFWHLLLLLWRHEFSEGFPDVSVVKNLPVNAGDVSLIPGWEDPLEEEMAINSSIFAWRIPMGREAWRATVHGVAEELDATEVTEQHFSW